MKTKPLIIEIPEPDSEGDCRPDCPLWTSRHDCKYSQERPYNKPAGMVSMPDKGCPWYKEAGDE